MGRTPTPLTHWRLTDAEREAMRHDLELAQVTVRAAYMKLAYAEEEVGRATRRRDNLARALKESKPA